MKERTYGTDLGTIVYWTNDIAPDRQTLVFLPGLTADHRLFDKQIARFEGQCNVLVWDAPGHAASRPFELAFKLEDKARWLHEILAQEGIERPILVGQSMGGYVSQMYLQLYPTQVAGFVCIDSAPLQRKYTGGAVLWMLKNVEPIYRAYPWKRLLKDGSWGCATTEYGRDLMREMMEEYNGNKDHYCRLAGHGFRMLAEAIEADLPYEITCPAVLVCGQKDMAGSAKAYNKKWAASTGLPMRWIQDAGHNANTDKPEEVNAIIQDLLDALS